MPEISILSSFLSAFSIMFISAGVFFVGVVILIAALIWIIVVAFFALEGFNYYMDRRESVSKASVAPTAPKEEIETFEI